MLGTYPAETAFLPPGKVERRHRWLACAAWTLTGMESCGASALVAAEYFKNTTLLLVGVICVAAAVEKWNLHKRIALRMVLMAGAKPGMLLLCFMCCTTLLSMWLSNTSTTAMVMPIVEAVLQELVSAEDEQLVAGNSSIEEAEPISLDVNNTQPSLELIFVNEE
ncbi:Solute carrier family 13 member 4 [Plecturocebus cupreus]